MIETGLGGRLDATNVLTPALVIITDIGIDHAEILGPKLADIAAEKAGIIKPGVPTLIGGVPREAGTVIRRTCRRLKAPLVALDKNEFEINRSKMTLDFRKSGTCWGTLKPSLKGLHQLRNCALVAKAASLLRQQGFSIAPSAVVRGVGSTRWPGRFQVLRLGAKAPTLILDVCHNAGGAAAFVDTFKRSFPGRRAQMIIGFVKRKQHQEMIDQMVAVADQFWLVPLASRRGVDTVDLMTSLDWKGRRVRRMARLESAYSRLMKEVGPDDIVAIVGSHFLVGEFLTRFGKK